MTEHKMLSDAKELLIKNILSGPRPGPDELLLMSEPYRTVWEVYDEKKADEQPGDIMGALDGGNEPIPDWADILD